MKTSQDAYGQAMLDHLHGKEAWEIVERDDGFFYVGAGPELYFSDFNEWRRVEREAMDFVTGRVLDIGCGAGRILLHLRNRGHKVIGIDNSPAAIQTCRQRGLDDVHVMSIGRISSTLGVFDTVLLLGSNLGLLGDPSKGERVLKRLHRLTTDQGRIIGASRDRTTSSDPDVREYVERNQRLGRLSGQARIRVRYRKLATPFFDYFSLSADELSQLLDGTGWGLSRVLREDESVYVAVLDKAS